MPQHRKSFNYTQLPCPHCNRTCRTSSGLSQHIKCAHAHLVDRHHDSPGSSPSPSPSPPLSHAPSPEELHNDLFPEVDLTPIEDVDKLRGPGKREYHPTMTGKPCDSDGTHLPPNVPPPPLSQRANNDWTPYRSRLEFETADFLFKKTQMSAGDIDTLMMLWSSSLLESNHSPPFANTSDLHNVIDATTLGDAPWNSFSVCYNGAIPSQNPPPWMTVDYEVFYRDPHVIIQNLFSNPDLDGEMDYVPYREFSVGGDRRYKDFMSGNWSWRHASIYYGNTVPDAAPTLLHDRARWPSCLSPKMR
ncbi:hypothetical protein QCA50_019863 [Cerrena zonata]|uniref:C2H2-type domain-containing protein n=1 Tax=Cerrena zonata TaxID=2478898 RepID=A0AAW0FGA2_9APHY